MKKSTVILFISVIVIMMIIIISVASNSYGTNTCAYSGCPREAHLGHTYCRTHKCANLSCDNPKPYDGSYCYECREKGNKN